VKSHFSLKKKREKKKEEEGIQLVVGTRGSALALAQTQAVIGLLEKQYNGIHQEKLRRRISITTKVIKTSGDDLYRKRNSKLTGKDSFTREIDLALIKGDIDFAVHSLKDVPMQQASRPQGTKLEIAAFPKRESPFDVLISRNDDDFSKLEDLKENARVGTSSLRRGIQLRLARPDLEIVEIHGNVPTRIRKLLDDPNLDAIVLAEAGLKRLHIKYNPNQVIPSEIMLPATGQGCLAVSVRSKDDKTKKIIKSIDDKNTRLCVLAEQAFSRELGGGCNTPIAALATFNGSSKTIRLEGMIAGETTRSGVKANFVVRDAIEGKAKDARSMGRKLARKLKAMIK
jgi:hydroxymethylbilane synthase